MEFTYRLTVWECVVCGAKRAFRQLFYGSKVFRTGLLILIGSAVLEGLLGIVEGSGLRIGGLLLVGGAMLLAGCVVLLIKVPSEIVMVYRQCGRRERTVRIRDGSIAVSTGTEVRTYRCRNILELKKRGCLYRIYMTGRLDQLTELYLPVRLLGGKPEQEEFRRYVNDQRRISGDKLILGELGEVLETAEHDGGMIQKWDLDKLTVAAAEGQWMTLHFMVRRRWKDWAQRNLMIFMSLGVIGMVMVFSLPYHGGMWSFWAIIFYVGIMIFRESGRGKQISLRAVRVSFEQYGAEVYEETWKLYFTSQGILRKIPMLETEWVWSKVGYLLETDDFYHFFTKEQRQMFYMEKALLGDWMAQKFFVQRCQANGISYEIVHPVLVRDSISDQKRTPALTVVSAMPEHRTTRNIPDTQTRWRKFWAKKEKGNKDADRGRLVVTVLAMTGIFLLAIFLPDFRGSQNFGDIPVMMDMPKEGEEYVFNPDAYDNYVPLAEQVKVLESLGFVIPGEVVDEMNRSMEEMPMGRVWAEGYPYVSLLTAIGSPEWDYQTWEITKYPEQAYWFDWEGFDLSMEYINILNGVNVMAGNDFTITEAEQDMSKVDWDKGTGTVYVRFLINGEPCEYHFKMTHDWLDADIVRDLNDALEKAGIEKRIYAMGDNGQGCILLYGDGAWAKRFAKGTGIKLETK